MFSSLFITLTLFRFLNMFGGKGFGVFKPALADLAVSVLEPINTELVKLLDDKPYLKMILNNGSERAKDISSKVLSDVYKVMGFIR